MRTPVLARLVPDPEKFLAAPPTEAAVWHMDPLTDVLSLSAVDVLAAGGCLRAATLSVVVGGQRQPAASYTWAGRPTQPGFSDAVRPAELAAALDRGATLVFESLQRTHRPVGDLCRRLAHETGVPVGANAYLTPAHAQGFAHHYDTHAVLIVQTEGSKTWQLSPPIFPDPLEHQPYRAAAAPAAWPAPFLEAVLRPGDVLWVPRGWIHNGFATDEPSLHLSLSLPPLTPYWVATELVRILDRDPRFRVDLPWGFGRDRSVRREAVASVVALLASALSDVDPMAAGDALADRWRRYFLEPARHPVSAALAPVTPDTPVRAVPEAVCGLDVLPDGRVRLHLGDTALLLDQPAGDLVVSRLAAPDPWTAASLRPALDEAASLDLVRGLLRAGVLARG